MSGGADSEHGMSGKMILLDINVKRLIIGIVLGVDRCQGYSRRDMKDGRSITSGKSIDG